MHIAPQKQILQTCQNSQVRRPEQSYSHCTTPENTIRPAIPAVITGRIVSYDASEYSTSALSGLAAVLHQICLDETINFTIHNSIHIGCLVISTMIFYTTVVKYITANL